MKNNLNIIPVASDKRRHKTERLPRNLKMVLNNRQLTNPHFEEVYFPQKRDTQ